jgi:Uncharacterized conserved protein (DUF2190)
MTENGKKTFEAGAAVSAKRLVQLSGGQVVHNTVTETDDPIGISEYMVAAQGDLLAVRLLNDTGTFEAEAAGPIAEDADIYAAADGKVQTLPVAVGTYRRIGKAIEAATADGDIIEILPYDYNATETVV